MHGLRRLWIVVGWLALAGVVAFAVAPPRSELPFGALPRPSELEGGLHGLAQYPEWCKAFGYTKTLLDKDTQRVIPEDLRNVFEASLESPWAAPCMWMYPDDAHAAAGAATAM